MWDHLSHARVLKLEKLVSMHNNIYIIYNNNIYIYIHEVFWNIPEAYTRTILVVLYNKYA